MVVKRTILQDVNSSLNKLSFDNYQNIIARIVHEVCHITDKRTLESIVDRIFSRVKSDSKFSKLYVILCNELIKYSPKFQKDHEIVSVERLLMNSCFEFVDQGANPDYSDNAESDKKCQMNINVFIAMMFNEGVIDINYLMIFVNLYTNILKADDETYTDTTDKNVAACMLSSLLTESGRKLNSSYNGDLCAIMTKIASVVDIAKTNKFYINKQSQFALEDLIKLHQNKWRSDPVKRLPMNIVASNTLTPAEFTKKYEVNSDTLFPGWSILHHKI